MTEADLVKRIKNQLEKEYPKSFWFKTHGGPFQMAGLPDLLGALNGWFIGIEVKLPGKEKNLTTKQQAVIRMITKAGGIAFMSTSVDHALNEVKSQLTKKNPR